MTDWTDYDLPEITESGNSYDSWWFTWAQPRMGGEIELRIDRIYEETLRWEGRCPTCGEWNSSWYQPYPGNKRITVLTPSRVNLLNGGRNGWKAHDDIFEGIMPDFPWGLCLQQAVEQTLIGYRSGNPVTDLSIQPQHDDGENFLLEPFIANSGVTVLYGEGGLGKSLLALSLGLAVCSDHPLFNVFPTRMGPVIYFDYEDDSVHHQRRLAALRKGAGIENTPYPLHHKTLVAKVNQAQSEMRQAVARTGAVMAIVDSIGMGRGGDAISAEDTIRLFRALRSFEVPVLAIDHVAKQERSKDEPLPYGSIYTVNSARLLWAAMPTDASTSSIKRLNLYNTKANHVARHKPMGIEIQYVEPDRKLEAVKLTLTDEAWAPMTTDAWAVIERCLDRYPDSMLTVTNIAKETSLSKDAVTKTMQRNKQAWLREKRGRSYHYTLVRHAQRQGLLRTDVGQEMDGHDE